VEPNPPLPGYKAGAIICVLWSTVQAAEQGWSDLQTSIRTCGWQLSMAAWSQGPDYSFLAQAMVVPFRSPYTRGTSGAEAIRLHRMSLLKRLQSFEIAHKQHIRELVVAAAYIGPGFEA